LASIISQDKTKRKENFPPTQAAQKMSNPDRVGPGIIDGLAVDPGVGVHNSYVWCTEFFPQDDGDYIWAGTNRDLGGGA